MWVNYPLQGQCMLCVCVRCSATDGSSDRSWRPLRCRGFRSRLLRQHSALPCSATGCVRRREHHRGGDRTTAATATVLPRTTTAALPTQLLGMIRSFCFRIFRFHLLGRQFLHVAERAILFFTDVSSFQHYNSNLTDAPTLIRKFVCRIDNVGRTLPNILYLQHSSADRLADTWGIVDLTQS